MNVKTISKETNKAAIDMFAELCRKGEQDAAWVAGQNGTTVTDVELTMIVHSADAQVRETYGFSIRDLFTGAVVTR